MRITLITIAFCLFSNAALAEVVLRGTITYQNTGEKMKTLQITARGASPTLVKTSTNTEGVFTLIFPNGKVGDLVTLELGTPIYDLVNDPRELTTTLVNNPNYKMRLVVCKKGERDANAVSYYNISTKYLEKTYQKQVQKKDVEIAKLEKQLAEKGTNEAELTKQLYAAKAQRAQLDDQLEAQKKNAFVLAEDFSRIDLAQADAIYKKAFETFKNGDIDGARAVLNSQEAKNQEQDLINLNADIEKREAQVQKTKESLKKAEKKIANAKEQRDTLKNGIIKKKMLDGKLAELQDKYEEAEQLYTEGVLLDTMNTSNLFILAKFLREQYKTDKAILIGNLGLRVAKSEISQANFCDLLNMAYYELYKFTESEKYAIQSLNLYEQLEKNNPQKFEARVAGVAMNLGMCYKEQKKMPEAEKYYLQSLKIRERLIQDSTEESKSYLAFTTMNMGLFYKALKDMPKAEKYYLQSLNIREQLVKKNPRKYEPDLATTAMNLGVFYKASDKLQEAEKYYLLALTIDARSAKSNPQKYEPDLATTAMNLGIFYRALNNSVEAKKYYHQSLNIREQLIKNNPTRFEPSLVNVLLHLATLYETLNDTSNAEKYYYQLLKLRERQAQNNPKEYESALMSILNHIGNFNLKINRFNEAQTLYSRALEFQQKAVQKNQKKSLDMYNIILGNIISLQDSFILRSDSVKVIETQSELEKSLKLVEECLDTIKTSWEAHLNLAWNQIRSKYYYSAEKSAKRGLELDKSKTDLLVNLAHALLLQNKDEEAEKLYKDIKSQKNSEGLPFRDILNKDFADLENAGLDKKQINKARKWITE
jgi:Tfp pilus assembly protein PilF